LAQLNTVRSTIDSWCAFSLYGSAARVRCSTIAPAAPSHRPAFEREFFETLPWQKIAGG